MKLALVRHPGRTPQRDPPRVRVVADEHALQAEWSYAGGEGEDWLMAARAPVHKTREHQPDAAGEALENRTPNSCSRPAATLVIGSRPNCPHSARTPSSPRGSARAASATEA